MEFSKPPPEPDTTTGELRLLREWFEGLPLRCRQIVAMRKIEGLSQKEIASRMEISVGAVESEMAKAIGLLPHVLDGDILEKS
jgi:RNA polymerase sigma-70 factor (ECF subfamily)